MVPAASAFVVADGHARVAIMCMAGAALVLLLGTLCMLWLSKRPARQVPQLQDETGNNDDVGGAASVGLAPSAVCACFLASRPDPGSVGVKTACFDAGMYYDITELVTYMPRYFRVASGMVAIAYEDKMLNGAVVATLAGPVERVVEHEPWARHVRSLVVYNSLARRPDTTPCAAMLRYSNDARPERTQSCLRVGLLERLDRMPATVEVTSGHRLQGFLENNCQGPAANAIVGPRKVYLDHNMKRWLSLRLERGSVVLYSRTQRQGMATVLEASQDRMPFVPQSLDLKDGVTLYAYSQTNYGGRVLFAATGPRIVDDLTNVSDGRNWASLMILTNRDTDAMSVTFEAEPTSSEAEPASARLRAGIYSNLQGVLGFRPVLVKVPKGLRLVAHNTETYKTVYNGAGPATASVPPSPAWQRVEIGTAAG